MAHANEKTNVADAGRHSPRWSFASRLRGHCEQAAEAAVAGTAEGARWKQPRREPSPPACSSTPSDKPNSALVVSHLGNQRRMQVSAE